MAITYKRPFMDSSTKVPILHKVYYGKPAQELWSSKGNFAHAYPKHNPAVIEWCEANCRAAWYQSPGYVKQCFIEFEDDEDAVMFALRWTNG